MVTNYTYLSLEEIERLIEENDKKLNEIWNADDGSSWEKYKKKCQPYWDDNMALEVAKSMKEKPEMKPMDSLDRKCRMTIAKFKDLCEWGAIMGSDGEGYYATEKEVSNVKAIPEAFVKGHIRTDFTHVCWYNK